MRVSQAEVTEGAAPPRPPLREVLRDARVALLMGVTLLSQISSYMVIPFMAIYFHAQLHFSVGATGFLVGLPFLSGLLLGVVGGLVSDHVGVARTYATAMVMQGLAYGALAVVHAYWGAAVLLILAGAVSPMSANGIQALLNQVVNPEHRGAVQNYLYWTQNVGVLVGLLVAAEFLAAGHSVTPFVVLLGLRVVMAAVVLGMFFRGDPAAAPAGPRRRRPGPLASLRAAASDRALLFAAVTLVLLIFMESQLSSTVPLRLTAAIADGSRWFGPLIAIDSVVVVLFQPVVMRILPARHPYLWFGVGMLGTGLGLAVGGVIDTVAAWIVGMVLYSFGEVIWSIKLNDLLGELPPAGSEGLYFSTVNTGTYLGMFVGMSLGSVLLRVPLELYGGMIGLALIGAYCFRVAGGYLRLRVVRDQAAAGQVTEAALPGVEAASPAPAVAEEVEVVTQGAAAAYAPRAGGVGSDFGIPMRAERMVLLAGLGPAEWEKLLAFTTTERFAPGDVLVERGAVDRALYLVESGELEVLVPAPGGGDRRLTLIEPGAVFGEQAFVDAAPRSAAIRGVQAGVVRRLEWEGFRRLAEAEPELARQLMTDLARILSERLRRTTEYVNLLASA